MVGSLRLTRHNCQGWPIPVAYSGREWDAADALAMATDDRGEPRTVRGAVRPQSHPFSA